MLKRITDIILSGIAIVLLFPVLLVISLLVFLSSRGPVFFLQNRIGRNGKEFRLIKFRTMRPKAETTGLLTIGSRDPRVTPVGYHLRKYKLDELPQLFNVLAGSMSLVGPRPEVQKYVSMYTPEQRKVLSVRPGITDYASIRYFQESDLLAGSPDPEKTYVQEIMPAKLALNIKYIEEAGFVTDLNILFRTIARIFRA
jgi:lipopolysaccharide/colanic/teichoic acid biosynthesis glycosyltransferase